MSETETTSRKRVTRSPSYPGIDLGAALERAQQLYEKEAHYEANVETILKHWGYAPKSGGGAVAVAALKSFGLLADRGSGDARMARLTDDALAILHTDGDALPLIQRAALIPRAHRELWERYGNGLPSDQTLHLHLTREKNFTANGARELVSEWKRTMKFAGLSGPGATVSADVPEPPEDEALSEPVAPMTKPVESRSRAGRPVQARFYGGGAGIGDDQIIIPVPLTEGMATVSLPLPLGDDSWDQLLAVLKAYKPLTTAKLADDD